MSDQLHYTLLCPLCGRRMPDDGRILACPGDHRPALLQTEYRVKDFTPDHGIDGIFRYRDWLPVRRSFPDAGRPVVFRSRGLSGILGLSNLWIAFSGYWPERGGRLRTGTFKELEAYAVMARTHDDDSSVLVVASAGNTAAAFAAVCSQYGRPCLLIVPERGLRRLRWQSPADPAVRVVAIEGGDYSDAIAVADRVSRLPGFHAEGGVRNVGRRDGLATVLYAAVEAMGELPHYYFQAVGSGAGAIAVHEAAKRLRALAYSRDRLPHLMLCQNALLAPIARAWHAGRRTLIETDAGHDRLAVTRVFADELTNRFPPYAIHSGVFDVLTESEGNALTVGNRPARDAMTMFSAAESIDIEPAAAVAVVGLRDAVRAGDVPPDAPVLLNITGGGRARLESEQPSFEAKADLTLEQKANVGTSVSRITDLVVT